MLLCWLTPARFVTFTIVNRNMRKNRCFSFHFLFWWTFRCVVRKTSRPNVVRGLLFTVLTWIERIAIVMFWSFVLCTPHKNTRVHYYYCCWKVFHFTTDAAAIFLFLLFFFAFFIIIIIRCYRTFSLARTHPSAKWHATIFVWFIHSLLSLSFSWFFILHLLRELVHVGHCSELTIFYSVRHFSLKCFVCSR